MRCALGSLRDRKNIPFSILLTETMRELAQLGHRVEEGDDYHGAWIRLGDTHPLMTLLIEGYYQLLIFGLHRLAPTGKPSSQSKLSQHY